MKMKKVNSFLAIVLVFLLFSSSASAESLFNVLPSSTPTPAAQSSVAPSYGDFAGVMEDEETENANGDTIVTYSNISARQMEDFGAALKEQGYVVLEQAEQNGVTASQLTNDVFTFILFYDATAQTLRTVYPKGTQYAQSLFPGYTKVYLNETFKIGGVGEFTFKETHLINSSELVKNYYTRNDFHFVQGYLVGFEYKNTSTKDMKFLGYRWYTSEDYTVVNDMFEGKMVYLNEDGEYVYSPENAGKYTGDYINNKSNNVIPPLEPCSLAITFNPPSGVTDTADGTLAMTMDFPNGEKYVLMLRENGVNLY